MLVHTCATFFITTITWSSAKSSAQVGTMQPLIQWRHGIKHIKLSMSIVTL